MEKLEKRVSRRRGRRRQAIARTLEAKRTGAEEAVLPIMPSQSEQVAANKDEYF